MSHVCMRPPPPRSGLRRPDAGMRLDLGVDLRAGGGRWRAHADTAVRAAHEDSVM